MTLTAAELLGRRLSHKRKEWIWQIAGDLAGKDPEGWEYTLTELVQMHRWAEALEVAGVGRSWSDDVLRHKKSETVVLLGSGPSIAKLAPKDWDAIAGADSIGFNNWYVHPFVPSMYMVQGTGYLADNLSKRAAEYSNIPIIARGSEFARGECDLADGRFRWMNAERTFLLREFPIHSRCSRRTDLLLDFFEAQGYLTFGSIARFVPKFRSTIGLLLCVAFQMGYKEIVLAGIDMQSSDHFWDLPGFSHLADLYVLPKENNLWTFTAKRQYGTPVPEFIYRFSAWSQYRNGVRVSVASPFTVLHPSLPVWDHGA